MEQCPANGQTCCYQLSDALLNHGGQKYIRNRSPHFNSCNCRILSRGSYKASGCLSSLPVCSAFSITPKLKGVDWSAGQVDVTGVVNDSECPGGKRFKLAPFVHGSHYLNTSRGTSDLFRISFNGQGVIVDFPGNANLLVSRGIGRNFLWWNYLNNHSRGTTDICVLSLCGQINFRLLGKQSHWILLDFQEKYRCTCLYKTLFYQSYVCCSSNMCTCKYEVFVQSSSKK